VAIWKTNGKTCGLLEICTHRQYTIHSNKGI